MHKVEDGLQLRYLAKKRDAIACSTFRLRESWIKENGLHVIASSNLSHFYDEEIDRLVQAFSQCGVTKLFAITNEGYLITQDHAYELSPSVREFEELEFEYFGEDFLLFSEKCEIVILFAKRNDYKLLAAPLKFLEDYCGNLQKQRVDFEDFAKIQISYSSDYPKYIDNLRKAINYMHWISG